MNMNRLINMGMRMVMRHGVNKGIDIASKRGKTADEMTPQERQAAGKARQNANRARRGLGLLRRFMR